ncbi:peptide hydrolase [Streptomyces rubellomurinus subsp. indigoferus]|nr:peptide hydrolase [Streptomyces rubellomurinus subsp. indigoferus]
MILRKHLATAAVTAALLGTTATTAVAQPAESASASASASAAQQLRRDTEAIHDLGISGVQARAIGPDGRQAVATSGTADLTTGRPVDPDGYFRMASTSKALVATVVLQLEAEGRLSLDDTVDHWLPGLVHTDGKGNGKDGRDVRIRDLLQHTSGITDDGLPGYDSPASYYAKRHDVYEPEQLVGFAMAHPAAGTWTYSNTGYVLLDLIIQKATGRPAHREVQDRIVRPLGLDRTRWTGTSPTLPRPHARAYQYYGPDFGPDARLDVTDQVPVDHENLAWVTTTRDENLFLRALLGGRLLPARQLAEMKHTVAVSPALKELWGDAGYGLGLVKRGLTCGGDYWGHEGGDGGFITLNGVTEDGRRSAVVSMSEARGDTLDHIKDQEKAASALIDHALCAGAPGTR